MDALERSNRNSGTVQKDWAVVKSNTLPDQLCIAVVGHQGWSRDPDSTARYALAVSFEVVGQEVAIYEPLNVAVDTWFTLAPDGSIIFLREIAPAENSLPELPLSTADRLGQ